MPVITGRDKDSVNIFTCQKLLQVNIALAILIAVFFIDGCFSGLASFGLHITHSYHLHIAFTQERSHNSASTVAQAYCAHHDTFARCRVPIGAKGR